MPTKKPSAKQLAARAKFVKMVRAKAAKSKAAKKKTLKSMISKYKYIIQDSEAGNFIDKYITLNEAKKELLKFEAQDKKDGIYKPYFYEIKNLNNKNIVGAVKKAAKKKTIKQTGSSNKVYDKRLQALKPGKRKTANPHKYRGKTIKKSTTYTENRENRTDKGRLLGIGKTFNFKYLKEYENIQKNILASEITIRQMKISLKQSKYFTPFDKIRTKKNIKNEQKYLAEQKIHLKELKKLL